MPLRRPLSRDFSRIPASRAQHKTRAKMQLLYNSPIALIACNELRPQGFQEEPSGPALEGRSVHIRRVTSSPLAAPTLPLSRKKIPTFCMATPRHTTTGPSRRPCQKCVTSFIYEGQRPGGAGLRSECAGFAEGVSCWRRAAFARAGGMTPCLIAEGPGLRNTAGSGPWPSGT